MNLIVKIRNILEKDMKIRITKIKRIKENDRILVLKIVTSCNLNYVFKLYKMKLDYELMDTLIDFMNKKNIKALHIIESGKIDDNTYYVYEENRGKSQNIYNKEMIDKVLDIIHLEETNILNQCSSKNTIFNKYNIYRNYFLINKSNKISNEVINYINNISKNIDIKYTNMSLIHGDLSISNIIWDNNEPSIIDFDEAIYAPIEYELMSFLIKTCFNNSFFNRKLACNIMKEIKLKFKKISYDNLRNAWLFYITKVLYEKFYYYELGYTDIENDNNRKDYWKWWIRILKTEELFDDIYFSDFNLKVLNNHNNVIKKDEKSLVIPVKFRNEKFVLKRRIISNEENAYIERELLNKLSFNGINVPRLLKIEICKNYVYKLYTFIDGKHKTEYSEKEESNLLIQLKKMIKVLQAVDINAPIGNIQKKIEKLINETDNAWYKKILIKLLNDKQFMTKIMQEDVQLIHDDLNSYNIIVNKLQIYFLDFEGIKKYPKSLQIASFITNSYLYEGKYKKINYVLSYFNCQNKNDMIKLITYRALKTLIYFENEIKIGNTRFAFNKKKLDKSLKKFLKDEGIQIWN